MLFLWPQLQLLWFFSPFPQIHGRPFPSTPKPNTVTLDAEPRHSYKNMHQATTKNCRLNCSSKILTSRCKRGPPSLGPNIFQMSAS